jgi:hypothetical protein
MTHSTQPQTEQMQATAPVATKTGRISSEQPVRKWFDVTVSFC